MIKKAKVISQYQINLYCDKCGTRMNRGERVLLAYPPIFEYTCPNCNHEQRSTIMYPLTQVQFDESNAEIIDESELHVPNVIIKEES